MSVDSVGAINLYVNNYYSNGYGNGFDSSLSGLGQSFLNELTHAGQTTDQSNGAGDFESILWLLLLLLLLQELSNSSDPFSDLGGGSDFGSSSGNYQTVGDYSSSAGAQPLSGGQKVKANQIYQYLISKYGFTPAQAAGIVGNMQVESSLDTGAYNSGEGAIGLCQWEGGRRAALEQFARSQGKSVTDWQVQVDFMVHELRGSESGAYSALKSATTPAQAAAIFDAEYERSAGTSRSQRVADANNIYSQLA